MRKVRTSVAACALLSALLLGGVEAAWAAGAGTVTHLAGTLSVQTQQGQKRLLGVNSSVENGDLLTTEEGTYARIKFADGAEVVMRPSSQLRVDSFVYDADKPESGNFVVSMLRGGLRAITGLIGKKRPENVKVNTNTATIGIRGTHFGALLCQSDCGGLTTSGGQPLENGLHVDVADGAIVVSNRAGEALIGAGQFGYVRDAGVVPLLVPPAGGIRIGIPPNIARNDAAGRSVGGNGNAECIAQ